MRIEARCKACARRYLLDPVFAGTVLPCPTCGAADGLQVKAPERPSVKPRAAAPADVASAAKAAATVERVAAAAPTEIEKVVCPRCKLHFVPRRDAPAAAVTGQRTVLVVEDMSVFRDIARSALTPRFVVKDAADLAGAREHLAQGPVDLIVLDPKLDHGESGIDLLRDLPPRHCPVVIYTDQNESEIYGESWERLRRLGADDLVVKGLHAGESLVRKVCELLGEQPAEDE